MIDCIYCWFGLGSIIDWWRRKCYPRSRALLAITAVVPGTHFFFVKEAALAEDALLAMTDVPTILLFSFRCKIRRTLT